MTLTHGMLLFFIYACMGWGCEVAFAAFKHGQFVNRGFLNGPICPIYGFGVLGVVLALEPVSDNLYWLFLGSVALTTAIEFVTGWALEALFHARWWDYSDMPLNIMGYVCLPFSILWGLACMVVVRWLHPLILRSAMLLPAWVCVSLDILFGAVFAVDLCATVAAVRKLSDRLTRLTEAAADLHAISDEIGQGIFDTTQSAREHMLKGAARLEDSQTRVEQWLKSQRAEADARTEALRARFESIRARINQAMGEYGFGHRRLLSAFPGLRSHSHQEALEALRRFYEAHKPGGNAR